MKAKDVAIVVDSVKYKGFSPKVLACDKIYFRNLHPEKDFIAIMKEGFTKNLPVLLKWV